MNLFYHLFKSTASILLLLLITAISVYSQTTSKEDLVYIQQAQYQQEMSYQQAKGSNSIVGGIVQHGEGHTAVLEQYGSSLKANITQEGANNTASVKQEGSYLEANISQNGEDNVANISQRGSNFSHNIIQEGHGHQITITKEGNFTGSEPSFSYEQIGTDKNLMIKMEGDAPAVQVIQSY